MFAFDDSRTKNKDLGSGSREQGAMMHAIECKFLRFII